MAPSTPAGKVVQDDGGLRLLFDREWDVPVAQVWKALTDPDRLALWFGRWTGEPSSGSVHLTPTGEGDDAAPEPVTIDACDPPHRLAVTTGGAGGRWPLEVRLDPRAGGGTSLRFVHRLAPADDVPSTGVGWHYYLDRLDAVVRGGTPTGAWDDYYPELLGAYGQPS